MFGTQLCPTGTTQDILEAATPLAKGPCLALSCLQTLPNLHSGANIEWFFLATGLLITLSCRDAVQRCVAVAQLLMEQNFSAITVYRGRTQEERLLSCGNQTQRTLS